MKSINFKTCELTEYAINGNESNPIRINLRDVNLRKRIESAGVRMKEIQQKYGDTLTADEAIAADAEIRAFLNSVFDTDVCTPAFGDTNCLTEVDDRPLFAHFFKSFGAIIAEDLRALAPQKTPAENPKIQQYVQPVITRKQPVAGLSDPFGELDVSTLSKEQKVNLICQLLG